MSNLISLNQFSLALRDCRGMAAISARFRFRRESLILRRWAAALETKIPRARGGFLRGRQSQNLASAFAQGGQDNCRQTEERRRLRGFGNRAYERYVQPVRRR